MIKTVFTATIAFGISLTALQAIIYQESFEIGIGGYTDGDSLSGQGPANPPATGNWSGSTAAQTQTGAALSYSSGLIDIAGAGGGVKQTAFDNASITRGTTLADDISTGGERWFSALVSMDSFGGSSDGIGVMFNSRVAQGNLTGMGLVDGRFVRYFGGTTPAPVVFDDSGDYTLGATALLIAKLTVTGTGGGVNESWQVWANPTDSSSEAQLTSTAVASTSTSGTLFGGDWGGLDVSVRLTGSGGSNDQLIDEIYVADSLASLNTVIAIPEPSTVALLGLGIMGGLIYAVRRRQAQA